MDVTLQHRQKI